jgi:hypothetical protein
MIAAWDTVVMSQCRKASLAGQFYLTISMSGEVDVPTTDLEKLRVFAEDPDASRAFVETKGVRLTYVDCLGIELNWGGGTA